MASDYENSKDGWGAAYKDGQIDTAWGDCEPLLTGEQLRTRHMMGIPIVSAITNPWTGKPDIITDTQLGEIIKQGVALAELELGIDIMSRQYEERMAYDQSEMLAFGYMRLRHFPAISVEELAVTSSDKHNVWLIPNDWIETGYLHQGQLHVIPFAVAAQSGTTIGTAGSAGWGRVPGIFNFSWVPALWRIKYSTGFRKGQIPIIINQLIGVIASMEVLGMLGATYARVQSSSLSIDGISESQSMPGANIFQPRLEELGAKRKWLCKKIKHLLGTGIVIGNV